MPITIDGNGTIGGITAGGLPDGTVDTDMLAANAVTEAKLGSDEQKGLAKAWVNFNGTGTVAIRSSFNVSSITDNATGQYTINYTTAFANTNYAVVGTSDGVYNGGIFCIGHGDSDNSGIQTANTRIEVRGGNGSGNPIDPTFVCAIAIST